MGMKLGAPNLMEHARLVRSWLWRWEDNTTIAPGAMTSDPILGEDIRGALFWDQGGTGEADALIAAAKDATDTMAFVQIPTVALGAGFLRIFNARDYRVRAEEDGGANMSALMQDFLEVVRDAGGGIAYFPAGAYRGSSIVVYANTTVLGDGIGRTIFKRRDGTASQIFLMDERATDITLCHMTLDGNRDNLAQGSGINLYGNRRLHIHDVEIKEMTGYGIGVAFDEFQTPIQDCLFENLWLHDMGHFTPGSEWQGDGFDGKRCRNSTWRNIRIHNIANTGLDIRGEMCVIENVQATLCGEHLRPSDEVGGKGIGLTNVPGGEDSLFDTMDPNPGAPLGYNILRDCIVSECAGNGFNITQENFDTDDIGWAGEEIINRAVISNCIARNNGRSGFEWHATSDCDGLTLAENCLSEGNTEHGFRYNMDQQEKTRATFAHCWAHDNGDHGFFDEGGADAHGAIFDTCRSTNNGGDGFHTDNPATVFPGCWADGNTGADFVGRPAEPVMTTDPGGATTTALTAEFAYLARVRVKEQVTISAITFYQQTSSGNVDVGIYASDGTTWTRLGSSGTVAAAGTGSQTVTLTAAVTLRPGQDYWLAFAPDNNTLTVSRKASANAAMGLIGNVAVGKSSSFPLPATLTSLSGSITTVWLMAS